MSTPLLQALTGDKALMGLHLDAEEGGGPKVSMKKLFSKPNIKKDGTPGKVRCTSSARFLNACLCFPFLHDTAPCWRSHQDRRLQVGSVGEAGSRQHTDATPQARFGLPLTLSFQIAADGAAGDGGDSDRPGVPRTLDLLLGPGRQGHLAAVQCAPGPDPSPHHLG